MEAKELLSQIEASIESKTNALTENIKKEFETKTLEYESRIKELETQLSTAKHITSVHDMSDDDPTSGFNKGFYEFAYAVFEAGKPGNMGVMDKRLSDSIKKAAGTGLTEATGSDGGFLIPVEYRTQLLQKAIEKTNILGDCTTIPMKTNSIKMPYINDTTHASATVHGGVRLYWEEELAEKTATKPAIGQLTLNLHKCIGMCYASDEILTDSPISLEPMINSMFTDALAWTLDNVFLNGGGGGQPVGILSAPCIIQVSKETNQLSTTLNYTNVLKMYMRMAGSSRGRAKWYANPDTIPQLYSMSLAVGTGGSAVFLPAGGASTRPYDTLFGRQVIFTEHCQTLGTVGDIYFADFSQYLVGRKTGAQGGLKADTSIHLKFDYDQTAFKFEENTDPFYSNIDSESCEFMGSPNAFLSMGNHEPSANYVH